MAAYAAAAAQYAENQYTGEQFFQPAFIPNHHHHEAQSKPQNDENSFIIMRENKGIKVPMKLTQHMNEDHCISPNAISPMRNNCGSPRRVYSPRPLLQNDNINHMMGSMSPNHIRNESLILSKEYDDVLEII